ncbi:Scramblase-domain-containing protein [Eremomyces bilateralis CBS 781.70]|uniref:Scramblase-domain-containing protein n=1 Tax=Eremomyces bilateralis CBS 781.70 TaxID=1392243 RepID=A0A6G1G2R0_9PEZI|nr:Scramblase-domain-containing protein [Eremomyces bilateralis CBS 781.70]KAF1812206.1 Scramblase-domain-containing protein [Eremomyces bilateralis CBS 781.70]
MFRISRLASTQAPSLASRRIRPRPFLPSPTVTRTLTSTPPRRQQPPTDDPSKTEPKPSLSDALRDDASSGQSRLLGTVHTHYTPHGVLQPDHPAARILENSSIVIQRQLEMMNVVLGFEQANEYVIHDPEGNHIGYILETGGGIGKGITRQMMRTHRSFTSHILDRTGKEVLRIHRPIKLIKSRISIHDAFTPSDPSLPGPDPTTTSLTPGQHLTSPQISPSPLSSLPIIGEAQSEWAPLRRKYHLFHHHSAPAGPGEFAQFASINEAFLSWSFMLRDEDGRVIGNVDRNWAGLGREFLTDTGVYVLRMDAAAEEAAAGTAQEGVEKSGPPADVPTLSLDQRAIMLATAVSIDFDYFSRSRGGFMPFPMFWGSSEAGTVGVGGVGGAAGGMGEGAMMGAGGAAVYETMQGGRGAGGVAAAEQGNAPPGQTFDDASPQGGQDGESSLWADDPPDQNVQDPWGEKSDPWSGQDDPYQQQDGGESGESGGGEGGFSFWDFFGDE